MEPNSEGKDSLEIKERLRPGRRSRRLDIYGVA